MQHNKAGVWRARLVGLALSGGGIRSATFCLGVLQGLGRLGILRFVDYLSSGFGRRLYWRRLEQFDRRRHIR